MSLIVYAYRRDPKSGRILDIEALPLPPRNDLAGFESWRQQVYGSPAARELGLKLLPSLVSGDLFAEGKDLDQLEMEAKALLSNIGFVADGNLESTVRFRIENILEAIRLAREVSNSEGGVYIG